MALNGLALQERADVGGSDLGVEVGDDRVQQVRDLRRVSVQDDGVRECGELGPDDAQELPTSNLLGRQIGTSRRGGGEAVLQELDPEQGLSELLTVADDEIADGPSVPVVEVGVVEVRLVPGQGLEVNDGADVVQMTFEHATQHHCTEALLRDAGHAG